MPEHAEDDQARRRVPKRPTRMPSTTMRLDALVVADPSGRPSEAREARRAEFASSLKKHGQERAVGDDEAHVLPDHPPQLVLGGSGAEPSTRLSSRVKVSMVSREIAASISSLARK